MNFELLKSGSIISPRTSPSLISMLTCYTITSFPLSQVAEDLLCEPSCAKVELLHPLFWHFSGVRVKKCARWTPCSHPSPPTCHPIPTL